MIFYLIFLNCGQLVNLKICVVGFPRAFWIFGSGSVFCSTDHNWDLKPIKPYWHELWKQEKSSSLVPPRVIYFIRLNGLGRVSKQSDWFQFLPPIFYLVFVIKNQLTHPDPKRIGGGKCPLSCQLGLTQMFEVRGHSTTTWTKFYPILTPSTPRVDNCGYFTWYLPFVMWPSLDFLLTPSPLFLST